MEHGDEDAFLLSRPRARASNPAHDRRDDAAVTQRFDDVDDDNDNDNVDDNVQDNKRTTLVRAPNPQPKRAKRSARDFLFSGSPVQPRSRPRHLAAGRVIGPVTPVSSPLQAAGPPLRSGSVAAGSAGSASGPASRRSARSFLASSTLPAATPVAARDIQPPELVRVSKHALLQPSRAARSSSAGDRADAWLDTAVLCESSELQAAAYLRFLTEHPAVQVARRERCNSKLVAACAKRLALLSSSVALLLPVLQPVQTDEERDKALKTCQIVLADDVESAKKLFYRLLDDTSLCIQPSMSGKLAVLPVLLRSLPPSAHPVLVCADAPAALPLLRAALPAYGFPVLFDGTMSCQEQELNDAAACPLVLAAAAQQMHPSWQRHVRVVIVFDIAWRSTASPCYTTLPGPLHVYRLVNRTSIEAVLLARMLDLLAAGRTAELMSSAALFCLPDELPSVQRVLDACPVLESRSADPHCYQLRSLPLGLDQVAAAATTDQPVPVHASAASAAEPRSSGNHVPQRKRQRRIAATSTTTTRQAREVAAADDDADDVVDVDVAAAISSAAAQSRCTGGAAAATSSATKRQRRLRRMPSINMPPQVPTTQRQFRLWRRFLRYIGDRDVADVSRRLITLTNVELQREADLINARSRGSTTPATS